MAARAFNSAETPVQNAADLLSFEAITRAACVSTRAFTVTCVPVYPGTSTVRLSGNLTTLALNHRYAHYNFKALRAEPALSSKKSEPCLPGRVPVFV